MTLTTRTQTPLASGLSTAFNQAAPKIVTLGDLQNNLDAFSDANHLTASDRSLLQKGEDDVFNRSFAQGGAGLYVDTNNPSMSHMYVDSKFVNTAMSSFLQNQNLSTAERAQILKVEHTVAQAINASPDQSPKLATGQIRPVTLKV